LEKTGFAENMQYSSWYKLWIKMLTSKHWQLT